jgi:CMP/dCMP kinase
MFYLFLCLQSMKKIIIAIDGYSSCGKSTLAKELARRLHYNYIDSGAMYRAVTYYILQKKISLTELQLMTDKELSKLLDEIDISFHVNPGTKLSEIYLNDENAEAHIRTMEVSQLVSPISAIHSIRVKLVAIQHSYGEKKGIVMDGRDIGTKVFPNAELKIFMTADKEVRAKRRFDELTSKGVKVTMDEVHRNIESRDLQDTTRKESPLVQASDAIVLDNSNMNEQEQFDFALNLVKKLGVQV